MAWTGCPRRPGLPGSGLAIAAAAVVLGLAPAPAPAAQPGVVLSRLDPGAIPLVRASGARHVRIYISWRALEPSPGKLGPEVGTYDYLVDQLRARGIGSYFVVFQTPKWASSGGSPRAPPPADRYADFMRRLAAHFRGRVLAYEVWNEPDAPTFWRGGASPAAYANLLRAAYGAVKAGDPGTRVGVGGLVGQNYPYLEALYRQGARGSFDFVSVHTDTGCNRTDPRRAARDVDGRISRWSFTGYREVRQTMLSHGDDKPIWITELGWSVTSRRCANGRGRAGVSKAVQARFLRRAYACLAADPYMEVGTWFSLTDLGRRNTMANRYGLMTFGAAGRPAFSAFQRIGSVAPDPSCGIAVDRGGPVVGLIKPQNGQVRSGNLPYRATASDAAGVRTLALLVDGRQVRITGKRRLRGVWRGWRRLANGPHTVRVRAVDRARNVSTAAVTVTKVPYGLAEPVPTRISLRVYGGGRSRLAGARLYTRPRSARALAQGALVLTWQRRSGKRWTRLGGSASRPVGGTLRSRRRLKRGRYRVVVAYAGFRSFRPAVARRTFRVG